MRSLLVYFVDALGSRPQSVRRPVDDASSDDLSDDQEKKSVIETISQFLVT